MATPTPAISAGSMPLPKRQLGNSSLFVSVMGLGCMTMSPPFATPDNEQSIATVHRALDLGVTLLDTADVYGRGHNEELVGKAIRDRRDKVILASKFGFILDATGMLAGVNGRPEYVRSACEASLRRLGLDTIDLYYLHRLDPQTPIEETVGAMAELIRKGKVRYLGLSEVGPQTLRRACAVHPIAALQSEYSLWTRDHEFRVLPACRELGIGFVAFSPLGRGFLTANISTLDDLPADDWRRRQPRFAEENFSRNLELVSRVKQLAAQKGCTPAQLALAWVLAQGQDIVPIPGTRRRSYLEENIAAVQVHLTAAEISTISALMPPGIAAGPRYAPAFQKFVSSE